MSNAPEQFTSRRERRRFELEQAARLEAESAVAAPTAPELAVPAYVPQPQPVAQAPAPELAVPAYVPQPVAEAPAPAYVPQPQMPAPTGPSYSAEPPAVPAPAAFEQPPAPAFTPEPAAMFGTPDLADSMFSSSAAETPADAAASLPPASEPALDDDAADEFFRQAQSASAPMSIASAPAPAWQPDIQADPTMVPPPHEPEVEAQTTIPMVTGGAPKRPDPKPAPPPESKGVNLWAAIAITATLASAVLTYIPPTSFIAPFIAFLAVPLAIVAIFLPGFNRIQSIVTLVLALGFGGYNAYTMFFAPPEEPAAVSEVPTPTLFTISAAGEGQAAVTWTLEETGSVIDETNEAAALPFSLALPATDPGLVALTVTVTSNDGSPVSCAVSLNGQAVTEAASAEDGSPAVCSFRGDRLEGDPATEVPTEDPAEEPAEEPAPAEPTPAP